MEERESVCARKTPFLQIRKKLLQKHEEVGIIRSQPDSYFADLDIEEVKWQLHRLQEVIDTSETEHTLRENPNKPVDSVSLKYGMIMQQVQATVTFLF